jgi:hypothetical protein
MLLALDYRTGKVRWSSDPLGAAATGSLHGGWPGVHQSNRDTWSRWMRRPGGEKVRCGT